MNLRHERNANANTTFNHIPESIHTLYSLALHRPIGTPHSHRHTIFRVVPRDWRFLWILAACLVGFHWCTTLNAYANIQRNGDASSGPLDQNKHVHVNLQTTAMSDLLLVLC